MNAILLKNGDRIRCTWRTPVIHRFSSRKCDIMKEPAERSARRTKERTMEQEDLIRGKVRFVFIPLVHTMGYTPRFHPPNGILGREKVCRVTVYCELVPPSFCFVQDSPTTRLTPMPRTRVSSFSGI